MSRKSHGNASDDKLVRIIGGTIGFILGVVIVWYFFAYGAAALFGAS